MKSQKEDLHRNRLIIIMMESKTARTLDDCVCVVCGMCGTYITTRWLCSFVTIS